MKFKSLHIKNFRVLEDFEVKKLGRLNLIVGKNNSGKSSVLEALRIYAGNAHPYLMLKIAAAHDERASISNKELNEEDSIRPFESFFTGRCFPADDEEKTIIIGELNNLHEALQLQHVYLGRIEETYQDEQRVKIQPILKSTLKDLGLTDENISQGIRVSKAGKISWFALDESFRARRFLNFDDRENFPCSYIPTQFVDMDVLAEEWDKITLTEHEKYVRTALQFIENEFENLAFVSNDSRASDVSRFSARASSRVAKVKLKNMKRPVPLNSMGDGMLRVLQLALKIFPAKGGFLLIDEFENGLHFSIQEKIWVLLFALAERLDIQVFATTHSWDAVDSFKKVAERSNHEAVLFRVGRSVKTSDKGKVIATEFDKEKLATLTQADVEVR